MTCCNPKRNGTQTRCARAAKMASNPPFSICFALPSFASFRLMGCDRDRGHHDCRSHCLWREQGKKARTDGARTEARNAEQTGSLTASAIRIWAPTSFQAAAESPSANTAAQLSAAPIHIPGQLIATAGPQ